MEMCYDGALVMPKNYAVVNEEEMTYVDGGIFKSVNHHFLSGYSARNWCNSMAARCWGLYACGIIGSAAIGALVGTIANPGAGTAIGGLVGVFIGCFMSDVIADWAKALDNAAIEANRKGIRSCTVNTTFSNLTLSVSVY